MLDEWPEASNQFFTWRQVFFQSHPRARPVVQIAAVGRSIGGRRRGSRAVYSGSLRLENRPCHGIDHDFKPLPSPSGICLPTRPLRPRQEKHRSGRPAAGGLGGGLLGVPPARARLRSSPPSGASSSFRCGAFWFSCCTACDASTAGIWSAGAWNIAHCSRSAPLVWMKSSTPKATNT